MTCLVARPRAEEVSAAAHVRELVPPVVRRFTSPHESVPRTHLLSNGRYGVMVTTAGSGYSRWRKHRGHALARGRYPGLLGLLHLSSRCADVAMFGRRGTSPAASKPTPTKLPLAKIAPNSFGVTAP